MHVAQPFTNQPSLALILKPRAKLQAKIKAKA